MYIGTYQHHNQDKQHLYHPKSFLCPSASVHKVHHTEDPKPTGEIAQQSATASKLTRNKNGAIQTDI